MTKTVRAACASLCHSILERTDDQPNHVAFNMVSANGKITPVICVANPGGSYALRPSMCIENAVMVVESSKDIRVALVADIVAAHEHTATWRVKRHWHGKSRDPQFKPFPEGLHLEVKPKVRITRPTYVPVKIGTSRSITIHKKDAPDTIYFSVVDDEVFVSTYRQLEPVLRESDCWKNPTVKGRGGYNLKASKSKHFKKVTDPAVLDAILSTLS